MKGARGFTLIEALVAFAILATMLVALYGALGTSLQGLSKSARYEEAVLAAEARLAELTATRALPQLLDGAIEGSAFKWHIDVIPDDGPEPPERAISPLRPQRIKLEILWQEGGAPHKIAVER